MHPDMMDNYTQIIFCVSLSDYDQPSDKFQVMIFMGSFSDKPFVDDNG